MDWTDTLLDEIALEGLDGITFQALWLRLENSGTTFFSKPLDKPMKEIIWNVIVRFKDVQFFELTEPRPHLVLFDWFCENDENQKPPEFIYEHLAIDDTANNIMGSCSTYYTRTEVTDEARKMSFDEAVARWNQKLVMVASQKVRNHALVGPSADPFMELFCLPYCMLERIGRSRYSGEITNCKWSLQAMGIDPKTIFYHRKYLSQRKLICKQFFFVSRSVLIQGNGNLLHLPRFYVEYESRLLFHLTSIINHLKKVDKYTDTLDAILKIVGSNRYRKRLFKSVEFAKLISVEVVPYKQYYPNATKKECTTSKGTAKEVKTMRLKYPTVNVREFFDQLHDDEDEEDEGGSLFLNEANRLMDRSTCAQSYEIVEAAGPTGICRVELGQKLGLNRVMSRIIMKTLENQGYIGSVAVDVGKVRIPQYFSLKFAMNIQERKKIIQEQARTAIILGTPEKQSDKRKGEPLEEDTDAKKLKLDEKSEQVFVGLQMDVTDVDSESAAMESEPPMVKDENEVDVSISSQLDGLEVNTPKQETVVDVSIISTPTYLNYNTERILSKDLTSLRMHKRLNIIFEAVKKAEIITNIHHLKKIILKAEENEQDKIQIDKKTLLKLLLRLETEGHIKTHTFFLKAKTRQEKLTLICMPHITAENHVFKNAIDHAKLRMSIISKEKVKAAASMCSSNKSTPVVQPIPPISTSRPDSKTPAYDVSTLSGVCLQNFKNVPKFVKIQLIHQLLFYQVHFYEGDPDLDQGVIKSEISALADLNAIKDVTLPKVYHFSKDLNWKLFIPPPSKLAELAEGWITIGEMVLRMPLSMLVQISSLNYLIPEIYDYLSHPVYKHILLKDLPISIRSALTYGRIYVLAIHRVLTLAAYLGLVQFGPHKHKDKDQVKVYLNRHASLYNTTSSKRGYIYVSPNIEYPRMTYYFKSIDDVNQYWMDAMMYCTDTQLGSREQMCGKSVVIENLDSKTDMIKAATGRSFAEAEQNDNGDIPGDHKGAAGFDSALYAHLKRNWYWSNSTQRKPIKLHPCIETNVLEGCKKSLSSSSKPMEASRNTIVVKKLKSKKPNSAVTVLPKQFVKKSLPRIRLFKEKTARVRKPLYDDVDRRALELLKTERVTWSREEDNILLLIKVAAYYFNQKNQRCISYYRTARDFLHQQMEISKNKTSKAVQRRLLNLSHRPQVQHVLSVCEAELQTDQSLQKRFAEALEQCTKDVSITDRDVKHRNKIILKAMVDLTLILLKRYPKIYLSCSSNEENKSQFIPNSVAALRSMYDLACPSLDDKTSKPLSTYDIHLSVITTLVYSSICCQSSKTSFSLQLFYAFKHYPEKYLRSALSKLQSEHMISKRKHAAKYSKMKVSSFLPITSSCYQLSQVYSVKLMCKYQHIIFRRAHTFSSEMNRVKSKPVNDYDGGLAAILSSFVSSRQVDFDISIPDQLIAINPAVEGNRLADARLIMRMKNHFLGFTPVSKNPKKKDWQEKSDNISDSEGSDSDFESTILEKLSKETQSFVKEHLPTTSKNKKKGKSDLLSNIAQNFKSEDLFFVKGCDFGIKLKNVEKSQLLLLETDDSYVSVTEEDFKTRAHSVIEDFKSKFVFAPPSEEQVKKVISEWGMDSRVAEDIVAFIESKKEFGASAFEIGNNFGVSSHIYSILSALRYNQIILRSGTNQIQYIHWKHSRSWLVHSFQMVRLDREGLAAEIVSSIVEQKDDSKVIEVDTITEMELEDASSSSTLDKANAASEKGLTTTAAGTDTNITEAGLEDASSSSTLDKANAASEKGLITTAAGTDANITEAGLEDASSSSILDNANAANEKGAVTTAAGAVTNVSNDGQNKTTRGKTSKRRKKDDSAENLDELNAKHTRKNRREQSYQKIKSLSENEKKQLQIVVRPWVKPDGSLNRRVLDRYLGIVLSRVMEKPLCNVAFIQSKFVPLLEPVYTFELIEILEKLGCLSLKAKIVSGKVNLFSSSPPTVKLVPAIGLENEKNLVINVGVHSVGNLARFIGDTAYQTDFMVD